MQGRIAFVVFISLGCLILGSLFALVITDPRAAPGNPAPVAEAVTPVTETPTPSLGAQRSVLLLVVDSRAAPQPRLEGCWVLTFTPNTPQYYWVGFSTRAVVPASSQSLQDYYLSGPSPDDREDFVKAGLAALTENSIQPALSATIDRDLLADLVTVGGGVPQPPGEGDPLNGPALLAEFDALPPEQQLQFQKTALAAFVQHIQAAGWTEQLLDVFYHRYQTISPDAAELLTLAKQALPFSQAQFSYTLWGESGSP